MTSRTVLVTGAARRIGAAIVRDLHERGMNTVIHCHHSTSAAGELADELNQCRSDSALVIQGDLMTFDNYSGIIEQAHNFKQRLDVLVNNASSFFPTPMGQVSIEQWQDLIGVNMQAPFFLAQHAADYLAANAGCIINLTDIHADRPLKDYPVYSAAKAGLVMITRALARELGPAVRVNGLSPGAILWPEDMSSDRQEEILEKTTMGRVAKLEDVTRAVRFLVEDADYITGQVLAIDGGRTLYS